MNHLVDKKSNLQHNNRVFSRIDCYSGNGNAASHSVYFICTSPFIYTTSSTFKGIWTLSRLINRTSRCTSRSQAESSSFIFRRCSEEQMGTAVIVWAKAPAGR